MKKIRVTIICILLPIILLCACQASLTTDEPTSMPDKVLPISDTTAGTRLVLPMRTLQDQSARLAYVNALLSNAGLNVTLEVYIGNTENYLEDYANYVRNNIDEQAVFAVPTELADQLENEGLLQDMYPALINNAPNYLALHGDTAESAYSTKISHSLPSPSRLAVLVKHESYEAFGKPVRTASELRELLTFLQLHNGNSIPGAMSPTLEDRLYSDNGYSALSLFLPEYGYYPMDACFNAYNNNLNFYFSPQTQKMYSPHELPETSEALKELCEMGQSKLIQFWTTKESVDLDAFEVLICDIRDITMQRINQIYPAWGAIDFTSYNINILYTTTMPLIQSSSPYLGTTVVAGIETDLRDYMRWLEWMGEEENYHQFMYGKEGTDYQLVEGRIQFLETDLRYDMWDQRDLFINSDYEFTLHGSFPSNFDEEITLISYPQHLIMEFGPSEYEEVRPYEEMVNRHAAIYQTLFDTLYASKTTRYVSEIDETISQLLPMQQNIGKILMPKESRNSVIVVLQFPHKGMDFVPDVFLGSRQIA